MIIPPGLYATDVAVPEKLYELWVFEYHYSDQEYFWKMFAIGQRTPDTISTFRLLLCVPLYVWDRQKPFYHPEEEDRKTLRRACREIQFEDLPLYMHLEPTSHFEEYFRT